MVVMVVGALGVVVGAPLSALRRPPTRGELVAASMAVVKLARSWSVPGQVSTVVIIAMRGS